ncbi:hypothetical protein HU200_024624 [Digitaria exilis]|uniref:SKP1-like protein n=1 Tax=Digitaria exilis TaxID=1010633 RepID=A0A835C364_9POAL|nr:hypothetical protein HU200_024624 [Digitaria exilis]
MPDIDSRFVRRHGGEDLPHARTYPNLTHVLLRQRKPAPKYPPPRPSLRTGSQQESIATTYTLQQNRLACPPPPDTKVSNTYHSHAATMSSAEEKIAEPATSAAVAHVAEEVAAEEEEKVVLRCCDGEEFAVAVSVAQKCGTISNMIDDDCVEGGVPLPNVKAPAMARVLEYLNFITTTSAAAAEEAVKKECEKGFFDKMAKEALFDVILAANYLHAEELLDASMQCAADRARGKTVPELREYFGLVNDFTPEEEEEIRKENSWAFD